MLSFRSLFLGSLFAIAACGGSKSPPQTPKPGSGVASNDPSCPVAVPGTSVTVEDSNTGAALVFVTTGDVGDLRRRVGEMAKMHNDHHDAMGHLPDGSDAGGGHAGHDMSGHAGHDMSGHARHDMSSHAGHAGGMIGVHSKASANDIDGGAKLSFVAGSSEVAKLQSELRMHAQHMSTGTCSMEKS